jgi:hypothetical protein
MTTCFFCQNLLSDYIEGILPSARHEELKRHLEWCRTCNEVHRDLETTLDLLRAIPPRPLSHDMALRITEASQAGKRKVLTRARLSQIVIVLAVPALLFATAVVTFPKLFPWFTRFRVSQDESLFARYYPLAQGAAEIVDEQTNWLHVREPFMRSVWEEGGLSPEEFEKAFKPGAKQSPGQAPHQQEKPVEGGDFPD